MSPLALSFCVVWCNPTFWRISRRDKLTWTANLKGLHMFPPLNITQNKRSDDYHVELLGGDVALQNTFEETRVEINFTKHLGICENPSDMYWSNSNFFWLQKILPTFTRDLCRKFRALQNRTCCFSFQEINMSWKGPRNWPLHQNWSHRKWRRGCPVFPPPCCWWPP